MYPPQRIPNRRPPNSEDCVIEVRKSKSGTKKIVIKGSCSKSQLEYAKQATGIDEVESD